MTRSLANRRTAAVIAAVLALGAAAPAAGARPVDSGPVFQPAVPVPAPTTSLHAVATRPGGGDISDLGYVAIGSGVAALAMLTVGGTRTATRRRRQRMATQARVAA